MLYCLQQCKYFRLLRLERKIKMANDIYFRTSIGGYNKQDVMKFIEKLNCEQTERVNELNEQNRMLQNEMRKISDELNAVKLRAEHLDASLQEKEELAKVSAEKAAKYDDMQSSFADLMLNAEHEAQQKIVQAEEQAKKIIQDAYDEIERKHRELDELRAGFTDTFIENKQIIERSKEEFSTVFEKITSSIENVYSKVKSAYEKANKKD